MNIATRKDCLTPLLVAAKYSVKNSVVWMLGSKDTASIHTSAVTAAGQNALHLVVQNQQCEYSLEVSTLNHFLLQKHIHMYMHACSTHTLYTAIHRRVC